MTILLALPCPSSGADEVVLFERATFLVIAHATEVSHDDVHRFEKISNIVKQFKLSVSKTSHEFEGMMVSSGGRRGGKVFRQTCQQIRSCGYRCYCFFCYYCYSVVVFADSFFFYLYELLKILVLVLEEKMIN